MYSDIRIWSAVLHKAFSVALKQGLISSSLREGAELPKAARRDITPLADEEIPRFPEAIDASPTRNAKGKIKGIPLKTGSKKALYPLKYKAFLLARKEGFEPSRRFYPAYSLSRGAPSATWVLPRIRMQFLD